MKREGLVLYLYMMEKPGGFFNKITKKALIGVAAISALASTEAKGQNNNYQNTQNKGEIKSASNYNWEACSVVKMPDQNMPDGVVRKEYGTQKIGNDGKPYFDPAASLFFLDASKTQAKFFTSNREADAYNGGVDYSKINNKMNGQGSELVIAFAGAYAGANGKIEGVAYENGISVGQQDHAAYGGVVYMSSLGGIELINCKDASGTFQEGTFNAIKQRAENEGGSFFQQKMVIVGGNVAPNFNPKDETPHEWRALCQTRTGEKFVINCHEGKGGGLSLAEFMKMALSMKDENGQKLVYDMVLEDTGAYARGVFRDKNQVAKDQQSGTFTGHTMAEAKYKDVKDGFTNTVAIGIKR